MLKDKAIFGISSIVLTKEEQEFIAKYKPHGIIFFKRNCESKKQIKALSDSIKLIDSEIQIFIDQEGGRVARIKPPITEKTYPDMEYFGEIYKNSGPEKAIEAVEQNFFELMSELKTFGIDVTCAPVCDLRHKGAHDVIGNRSFGYEVQMVIDLAGAALSGIHRAGGEGVLKHIPGHGRSMKDSHHDLPIVDASLEELEKTDFAVFKALADKCKYAMTAHLIYTCLDDKNPITTSPTGINYIRTQIGFKETLMTDDINMKALPGTIEEKALASLQVGCDIVLQCSGDIADMQKATVAAAEYMVG